MKILLISPFSKPDVGGVESHIEKLITYLCEVKSADVTFVTYMPLNSSAHAPKYEKYDHLEIFRMPWFGRGWFRKLEPYFPLNFFYLLPGLLYKSIHVYMRQHKEIDVIHAHGFIAGAVAKCLAFFCHKRTVISTHAIYGLRKKTIKAKMFKWLLGGFDQILAVGEPSLEELIDIGLPPERVLVHPNWVNVKAFALTDSVIAKKELSLSTDDFVVLFVGRMIGIKGELILLDAARKARKDITFLFVGGGPEADKIIAESKINKKVIYLGFVPDEKMKDIYSMADLFVSPVLYDEGFATVYLEALASGTPVLTARRGCLPYFLTENVAEFLDCVNTDTVFQAIERNYQERVLLKEKRSVCRKYAESKFSEQNAEVIFNSYMEA